MLLHALCLHSRVQHNFHCSHVFFCYERVLSELMFFEQVSLGWEDEEGDVVTISSEEELEYARAHKRR